MTSNFAVVNPTLPSKATLDRKWCFPIRIARISTLPQVQQTKDKGQRCSTTTTKTSAHTHTHTKNPTPLSQAIARKEMALCNTTCTVIHTYPSRKHKTGNGAVQQQSQETSPLPNRAIARQRIVLFNNTYKRSLILSPVKHTRNSEVQTAIARQVQLTPAKRLHCRGLCFSRSFQGNSHFSPRFAFSRGHE